MKTEINPAAFTQWCSKPWRLLLLVAVSMYLAETLAKPLLGLLPAFSPGVHVLMEGVLHTLTVVPVLFFFLFRPMLLHLRARRLAEAELRRAHDELEERVAQRTAELAQANEALQADIAVRQRAETALRRSEMLYRNLVESMSEGLVQVDNEGRIRSVNEPFCEMTGYARGELLGEAEIAGLFDGPDLPVIRVQQALWRTGIADHYEARLRKKSGETVWVQVYGTPVVESDGTISGSIAILTDVTARKGAEEKLRRSEAQYRLLFEGNPHPMWILDVETLAFLAVNNAVVEHYGYSREEFARMTLADLCLPEAVPDMRANVVRTKATTDYVGVVRHRKKDGGVIFCEITVQALAFNGRRAELVLAHDVTETRQAHEALEREHKRLLLLNEIVRAIADHQDLPSLFRVVLKHLEDHLPIELGSAMLCDPQGATLTLVARGPASRALAAQNGWPKEGDTLNPEAAGLAPCLRGEMVYWRDTRQTDLLIPRQYGQAGLRSILGVPLRMENRTIGVLATARRGVNAFSDAERDFLRQLSEHVALAASHTDLLQNLQRAYDDLHQSQQTAMQQERLRALGEMASGIAHDINNALMPIVGFSDLLLQGDPALDADQKHCLHAIKTSGQDIAATVARMREFYRKRTNTEELRPVDLNQLVRQTIELTRPRWRDIPQERGRVITVETGLADCLPPLLGSDSELREALTNLIGNSVDALPQGGVITIRTRRAGNEVALEVTDMGVGMDEDVRRRCLEPFYTTKGERGTGLGLAMVYGIMQRHEGRIEIESELNVGTTMRLVFPRREAGPDGHPVVEPAHWPRGLRLLVVDDDPLVGDGVLKLMLQKDAHQVTVADGGEAGIAMFREAVQRGQAFDGVLTDLGMPYVDGREVARSIKAGSPQTPVILVTGWGTQLQAEGDILAEVDAVLGKPIRMMDLRQALARVFPPAATEPDKR